MAKTKDQIKQDLTVALPYFRSAINAIRAEGKTVKMGILAVNPDGSGKIEMQFDCDEFFADIATLVDLPDETTEDVMNYQAQKFLAEHGLTVERVD